MGHNELREKTKDLKMKNQQLDLLLLKAESYSHFISENQKRSRELWSRVNTETPQGKEIMSIERALRYTQMTT